VSAQFGNDCQNFKLTLADEPPGAFAGVKLARLWG